MNIYGSLLILATSTTAAIGTEVVDLGSKLANLGAVGILGVVSIVSVIGLIKLYKDKQKDSDETIELLRDTINKNTETLQALKDHCLKK